MSDLGTSDPIIREAAIYEYRYQDIFFKSWVEKTYPSYGWRIRTIKAKYAKGFSTGARK